MRYYKIFWELILKRILRNWRAASARSKEYTVCSLNQVFMHVVSRSKLSIVLLQKAMTAPGFH